MAPGGSRAAGNVGGQGIGMIGVCLCDDCRYNEMCHVRIAIEDAAMTDPRAAVVVHVVECSKAEAWGALRGVGDGAEVSTGRSEAATA